MAEKTVTDWPQDLPQLKILGDHLLCPICYDYMKTPVLSMNCSHNYCSLCIRKFISVKSSCPVCYSNLTDGALKPNRCLEEVIINYHPIKNYILNGKNKVADVQLSSAGPSTSAASAEKSYTSIRALPNERDASQQSYASTSGPEPSSSNNYQQPSSSSDQVSCPICQSNVKASLINSHLDMCLSRPSTTHTRPDVVAVPERRKPLPKWIYTIMKESELKKKLRELGLSSVGDKATLIARHKAYTILYNAECDAASPRPVEELRAILEEEEAENRRLNAASARPAQSTSRSTPQKIQEDNQRYLKVHKPAFDELINQIKERQKDEPPELKVEQPEETNSSHDEDDEITILPTPIKIIEEVTLPDSDEEASLGAAAKPSSLESSDSDSDLLDGFLPTHSVSASYSPVNAGLDDSSSLGFYPTMVPDVLASSSSATPSSSNSFMIPSPPVLNSSSSSKQSSPASSESMFPMENSIRGAVTRSRKRASALEDSTSTASSSESLTVGNKRTKTGNRGRLSSSTTTPP